MADVTVNPECPFSEETFNLLAQLDQDFYIAHEAEFKKYVEQPLQKLCRQVAAQLPNEIIKRLELKVEVSQNSYNEICCLGIFYDEITRLSMKNNFAQLFIYIDSNRLIFGLLIPDETNEKKRFIENLKTSFNKEIIFQNTSLPDNCELHFSSSGKSLDPEGVTSSSKAWLTLHFRPQASKR